MSQQGPVSVPPLSDPRIGFTVKEAEEFMMMGFDTTMLLAVMLQNPDEIREEFKQQGKDFDDVLRRIKSVVPPEVIEELERMAKETEELDGDILS